jgi:hypothetical protein
MSVPREAFPILKDDFLTFTRGGVHSKFLIFFANITYEFIFGLDILRVYDETRMPNAAPCRERGIAMDSRAVSCPSSLIVAE